MLVTFAVTRSPTWLVLVQTRELEVRARVVPEGMVPNGVSLTGVRSTVLPLRVVPVADR